MLAVGLGCGNTTDGSGAPDEGSGSDDTSSVDGGGPGPDGGSPDDGGATTSADSSDTADGTGSSADTADTADTADSGDTGDCDEDRCSGELPEWVPPVGTVRLFDAPGQKLRDVDPEDDPALNPNHPGDAPWHGNSGQRSVLDAWTSGAASDDHYFSFAQGGHHGYAGNEAYRLGPFDAPEPPEFELAIPPSTSVQMDVTYYADGSPSSCHGYNNMEYIEAGLGGLDDRVVVVSPTSTFGSGNTGSTQVWGWDLSSNAYDPMGTIANATNGGFTGAAEWDPVDKLLWFMARSPSQLQSFDPVTNAWTNHQQVNGYAIDFSLVIDPVRRIAILMNDRDYDVMKVFDLDNPSAAPVEPSFPSGGPQLAKVGAEYDPVLGAPVYWDDGPSLWELQIPADPLSAGASYTWAEHTFEIDGSAPVPSANGVYGKFQYIRTINAFVAVTTQDGYWVWKLTPGA